MITAPPSGPTIVRFQARFRRSCLCAVGFLVFGMLLFLVINHRILGAAAAVIGAVFLMTAFQASGECPCPRCGYRIAGIGRTLSCCPSCGEYWMVNNRKLLQPYD